MGLTRSYLELLTTNGVATCWRGAEKNCDKAKGSSSGLIVKRANRPGLRNRRFFSAADLNQRENC